MMPSKPADSQADFPPGGKGLNPREISLIEAALKKIGAFGEVHLVVERGRLRFIRTIKSETVEEVRAWHS